jgi:hypothetical protein
VEVNAELLGNLGEFVGAIAVVLTLGYLALQIRQSNIAAQSSAIQTFFDSFSSVNSEIRGDVPFFSVLRKSFATWDGLSKDEQAQTHLYWVDYAGKLNMGFQLMKRGLLEEDAYEGFETFFLSCLLTPGVGGWWERFGPGFPQDFQERLSRKLSDDENKPLPVTETSTWWAS